MTNPGLALFGPGAVSDLSPLCARKQTSAGRSRLCVHALVPGRFARRNASKCAAQLLISPSEMGRDQKGNGGMCLVYRLTAPPSPTASRRTQAKSRNRAATKQHDGQITQNLSSPLAKNISVFP